MCHSSKEVGEHLFSDCCFQEEIEMIVRPELILTSFLGRLDDDEAVTVTNAKKFSFHTGFGETFQFHEAANPHKEVCPVLVLAPFRVVSKSGGLRQYSTKAINSYVRSAFSAIVHLHNIDKITFEFWAWSDLNVRSYFYFKFSFLYTQRKSKCTYNVLL
jgi:Poly (ADP-ribose) glycohydrolase (PARG)